MNEQPLGVLIVEDEVLLATELEFLLEEAGCCSLTKGSL